MNFAKPNSWKSFCGKLEKATKVAGINLTKVEGVKKANDALYICKKMVGI